MKPRIIFFLFLLAIFTGCSDFMDNWLRNNQIEYKRTVISNSFSSQYASFDLSTFNKELIIDFKWEKPADFLLPIHPVSGDTLKAAVFSFSFYENGKLIPINISHTESKNYNWLIDSSNLVIRTKPASIKYGYYKNLKIPLYFFHSLKAGKHNITVAVEILKFVKDENNNKDSILVDPDEKIENIKGSISFQLTVPAIRQSVLYMSGLELQNDSSWTPAGMDFYVWGSGYPEVFWEVFYPVKHKNDLSCPVFCSTQTYNTTNWMGYDTVNIFHYNDNEKIIIGVYDYDMLSRNDWLGDWYGNLNFLATNKDIYKRISFDHVSWLSVRIEQKGIINK